MSSDGAVIRLESVGKRYAIGATQERYRTLRDAITRSSKAIRAGRREHWALKNVDLAVHAGERVGIVGRNGAGKSTLLKIISKITQPTEGRGEVHGRVGSLLEVGTGFHPELTGRDNIFLNGVILGMHRREISAKIDQIVDFAGVSRYLDTPVKRYSSGMYLRLAFAVAAHLDSDVLLIDEVLAVGDAEFQKRCIGRMAEIGEEGRTLLFVSHSMPAVLRLCPRVILLDGGRLAADGESQKVVRFYMDAGGGSAAERTWDTDDAPGDEVARLVAVRVLVDGRPNDEVEIRQPVDLEVEYLRLTADPAVRPSVNLHLLNEDGLKLFVTNDFTEQAWHDLPSRPGLVRSRCRIPGNFLAEGRIFVLAAVSSYNPTMIHAMENDAVSFQVVDRSEGDGVRGPYANEWPGVVRPMLDWALDWQPLPGAAPTQP
ncbi:MAG TPA: ABC transporter ATP-binding protein [Acidimicrobiales bacterium]|nr:ABC transporter ATP-binding protein [Acidimicrobiales bacterium]